MNAYNGMLVVGQTDMYGIDVFIQQQLAVIIIYFYIPVAGLTAVLLYRPGVIIFYCLHARICPGLIQVTNGNNSGAAIPGNGSHVVGNGNSSATYGSHIDAIAGGIFPKY